MNKPKIAKDHETAWMGEAELATLAPSAPLEAEASWNHLEEVESAHGTKLLCPQVPPHSTGQDRTGPSRREYSFLFLLSI